MRPTRNSRTRSCHSMIGCMLARVSRRWDSTKGSVESVPLHEVVAACGGLLVGGAPDMLLCRVCTDSRRVEVGDLFVALAGEKFDAHDYLTEVARRGAAALVVEEAKVARTSGVADVLS